MNDILVIDIPEKETNKLEAVNNAAVRHAESITVANDVDYTHAAEFLKEVKVNIKSVEDTFADMKEKAYKAHRSVCDTESSFKKPLLAAEKIVKAKMQVYYSEQERLRREEDARIRAEQKRLADEQLKRAAELEAQGRAEEANAALQTASCIDALNTVITFQKPAAEGVSAQLDYDIQITNPNAVPAYIMGAEIRTIDVAAIKRLAKATKGNIQIPGVVIVPTKSIRVRV